MHEKFLKTKPSLKDIPMPDNLVGDLKKHKEWFRLADKSFDAMQDDYCLAVGLAGIPAYNRVHTHQTRIKKRV